MLTWFLSGPNCRILFLSFGMALVSILTGCFSLAVAAETLTLYSEGPSLIKESRTLSLKAGEQTVQLDQFPKGLIADSVQILEKTGPSFAVRQQTLYSDSLDRHTLLKAMVGSNIRFRDTTVTLEENDAPYPIVSGTLEYYPPHGGSYAIVNQNGKQRPVLTSDLLIDRLPADLALEPHLEWRLESAKAGSATTKLAYLSHGFHWHTIYSAILNPDNTLGLQGWAVVNNTSGKTYKNAELNLVAGSVNRATPPQHRYAAAPMMLKSAANDYAGAAMEESHLSATQLGEYHLYRFPDRVDLPEDKETQLSWLSAQGLPYKTVYVFDPNPDHFWIAYQQNYSTPQSEAHPQQQVESRIQFDNTAKGNSKHTLGQALPGGLIRIMKADGNGQLQLVGEDQLAATPEGEQIELTLGKAFDLLAEKEQVGYRSTKTYQEIDYKVTLTNRKKEAVTVEVVDHPYGDWKLLNASLPVSEQKASQVRFKVNVPAKGESFVSYTIRQTYRR